MKNKKAKKKKHKLIGSLILAVFNVSFLLFPIFVKAADPEFVVGQLFFWTPTGRQHYTTDPNPVDYSQIYAYRSNVYAAPEWNYGMFTDDRVSFTPADSIYPAFFACDPGSSFWDAPLYADEDVAMIAAETKNGQFGWTGNTWVGGGSMVIQGVPMISPNQEIPFADIVMEPIPTPALSTANENSITIGWQGLWDNDQGASSGTSNNSIYGYQVYKSTDGGSFSKISGAVISQSAGSNLTYADTDVSAGHTYQYKLSVLFKWEAKPTTPYWETTSQGPASVSLNVVTPEPDRLALTASSWTATAGQNSVIITVETRNSSGDVSVVLSDTTIDLTSTSSGTHKFYSVSSNACTSTEITSLPIAIGSSSAQFCYYDEKTSGPTWTITAHKSSPVTPSWTDGTHTFTITPASFGSFSLSLATPQRNRQAFTGTNTLTALDTFGNVKTNFQASLNNVTFSVSPTDGTISGLRGTNSNVLNQDSDFSSGVANLANKLTFSGTTGSHTFTATSADSKTTTATVNILGGAVSSFDFSLTSPQVMDTAFSSTNTLTAKDADGNVITDFDASINNVTITESVGGGIVSGLGSGANNVLNQAGDFSSGVADLSGKMTYGGLAGSRIFTAASGSASSNSNTVTFGPGAFAKFGLAFNSPQKNDEFFTSAAISAQDIYGNVVTSYDASAVGNDVTIASSGATMTISGGSAVLNQAESFVSGTADLSGILKYTGPMGTRSITVTNTTGRTGSVNITITAGDVASVKITNASGGSATEIGNTIMNVDSPLSLWATEYDVSGNFAGNSTAGHWTVTGFDATDTYSQVDVTNATNISFAPRKAPQSGTISFDSGTGMTDSTGTITVNPGAAKNFVIVVPTTAQVGTNFTNVQITANDQYGNLATEYTGSQTLTLSGPGNGPESGTPTSSVTASFTSGQASSTSAITLVKAETVKITLTQGLVSGQSSDVAVSAGDPAHLHAVSPTPVTAGVSFNLTSITAHDAYGNVATAYSGSKTIAYTGPVTSSSGDSPIYTASVDFTSGVSTTTLVTSLFTRETVIIHLDDGTINGDSNSIAVNASDTAASIEYISGNNQTAAVNSALPSPLVVAVKDNYGNLKDGYSVTFVVTGGDGQVSSSTATTASNGRAQVIWTIGSSTGSGFNEAQAQASGLTGSPIVFNAEGTPLAASLLDITTPSEVTAGVPFNITIKAIDALGNTVTTFTGSQTVSYSGPHSSPDGTAPSYTNIVEFTNGTNNVVSTTLYNAETVTLSANIGSLNGDSLPITVKAASESEFSLLAPSTATVNLPFVVSSMRALDEYGNIATTYDGSKAVSYSGPGDSSSGNHPSYTTSVTFNNGVATTQLDTTLVKAETTKITATSGSVSGTSNSIKVIYAEPYVLTYVSGNNQEGTPGSVLDKPLVAKVMDSNGSPASGKVVIFTPSAGSGSVDATSVTVGSDGLASVDWTLGSSGNIQIITASVAGLSSTVVYVANEGNGGSVSGNRLVFTTPSQKISPNISSGTITVCLQDVLGNNITASSDTKVNLSSNSTTGKFAQSATGSWDKTYSTISSGESCINFYYQDSTSGLITLTASSNDIISGNQSVYIESNSSGSKSDDNDDDNDEDDNDDDDDGETTNITKKIINEGDTNNYYTFIINNYYYNSTSNEDAFTNSEGKETVSIEAASVPSILSPRNSSLVLGTDEGVTVSGTAVPNKTVLIMADNKVIGSATSDRKGNWKTNISLEKIGKKDATLAAKLNGTDFRSTDVNFQIKDNLNWIQKIIKLIEK